MFSPAGVVAYTYGPQASGCVPYWMVAATAASSPAGVRVSLPGGQVPSGALPPESPTRAPPGTTSYPPSAVAYHDLLKRTAQLNELIYPAVIPLPGTLTAESTSPTSAARHPGAPSIATTSRSKQHEALRSAPDSLGHHPAGRDLRSPGLSPVHGHGGHPLSPSAVQSKDLKFGIDRILHPSRKGDDLAKDDGPRRENYDSGSSSLVRRPVAKNPVHHSPVLSPTRAPVYCPPTSGVYRSPEPGMGRSLSPGRACPRPGVMAPHPLSQQSFMAQQIAAAASYHYRPEYPGHLSMMGHNNQGSHHQEQSHPKRKRSWSRAVFSHLQRKGLEKRFEVQKYVTKPDRRQLAAMLGLTDAQVKVWFQNRRMKWRHAEEAKRKKEEEDKQHKTPNSSNATKPAESSNQPVSSSVSELDLSMKSDDENDSDDDSHRFEYSFENDGHNDELIVDEVSSEDGDEGDGDDTTLRRKTNDYRLQADSSSCDTTMKDELR